MEEFHATTKPLPYHSTAPDSTYRLALPLIKNHTNIVTMRIFQLKNTKNKTVKIKHQFLNNKCIPAQYLQAKEDVEALSQA